MELSLETYFTLRREEINACLERLMPSTSTPPTRLHEAMRYSVFAGGKRLRPLLVIAAGEAFEGNLNYLLPTGCAFEMLHTYSLIHDDLPAMDNDDLRRGMPTCHKQFDEATAILAGDALLTWAFQVLAEMEVPPALIERKIRVIAELAQAGGTVNGMIGGQMADIQAEGQPIDADMLAYIHRSKTGALIRAAVVCGGHMAGTTEDEIRILGRYGECIGLAFQIADDILDVTSTSEALGKTPGKDVAAGKATYPALFGLDASRQKAREVVDEAVDLVAPLGRRTDILVQLARFIVDRPS
ncbi:MAG: polyprenyl synthetase family protein [Acidobacteria bacterium]|nr:polyprenyl synthetase family protein [Acidobacteriota bacterium]